MKNGQYVVNRDDIYVGEVVDTKDIHQDEDDETQLEKGSFYRLRSMLFVLDENGFADDLLYNSPKYPVLNITDNGVVRAISPDGKDENASIVVVDEPFNLGEILKYYGYGEKMSISDVIRARNFLFSKGFMDDHCEDFGFRQTKLGYVSFDTSCEFFDAFGFIQDRSDGQLDNGRSAFAPKYEEGPVRKLIRPRKGLFRPTKK